MNQRRILLVDDEPGVRFVLSAVLEQSGYTVDQAEDGFSALRKIQQKRPDLVITDLRMPNMNGFELLFVIRTRFPELPTIAISGEFLTVAAQQGPLADAFFQRAITPSRTSWIKFPNFLLFHEKLFRSSQPMPNIAPNRLSGLPPAMLP